MNYYKVECKCGHVGGKHYYTLKTFPVFAENGKEAAAKARNFSRVKHHHKDAIRSVKEITIEEFYELKDRNDNDPFFWCVSYREWIFINDTRTIVYEENDDFLNDDYEDCFDERKNSSKKYHQKSEIRNPKKYFSKYNPETSLQNYCR